MTTRARILSEVRARIAEALPKAVIDVDAAVERKPPPGLVAIVILPGPDTPWSESEYDPSTFREWLLVVQVARAREADDAKDSLAAWERLEETWAAVDAAIRQGRSGDQTLDGLLKGRIERLAVASSEEPVGGVARGVEIEYRVRYVVAEE